jgi:hypothetical protein
LKIAVVSDGLSVLLLLYMKVPFFLLILYMKVTAVLLLLYMEVTELLLHR